MDTDINSKQLQFMTLGLPSAQSDFAWRAGLIAKYPDLFSKEIISFVSTLAQEKSVKPVKSYLESIPLEIQWDHLYENPRRPGQTEAGIKQTQKKPLFLNCFDLTVFFLVEMLINTISPANEDDLIKIFEMQTNIIKQSEGWWNSHLYLSQLKGSTPLDKSKAFFLNILNELIEHELMKIRAKLALWEIFCFFDRDLFIPKLVALSPQYLRDKSIISWIRQMKVYNSDANKLSLSRLSEAILNDPLKIKNGSGLGIAPLSIRRTLKNHFNKSKDHAKEMERVSSVVGIKLMHNSSAAIASDEIIEKMINNVGGHYHYPSTGTSSDKFKQHKHLMDETLFRLSSSKIGPTTKAVILTYLKIDNQLSSIEIGLAHSLDVFLMFNEVIQIPDTLIKLS